MIVKEFENAHSIEKWIPSDQCQEGYLYYIAARNSTLGIYHAQDKGFVISRFKFKSNYLFEEYHWETETAIAHDFIMKGTVKPLAIIEKAPLFEDDTQKLNYLNLRMRELNGTDITERYQLETEGQQP